jgi:hypothetical protein
MGLPARNDERAEPLDGATGSARFEAFFHDHYRVVPTVGACWFLIVLIVAVASFEYRGL